MPRSKVLTGRIQQRDRAQLRGKLDAKKKKWIKADSYAALDKWLKKHIPKESVTSIEKINTTWVIRETAKIHIPPEERLRQLAIFLENEITWREEQPRSWLALDRIYLAALRFNPDDIWLHDSRGLSACNCAEVLDRKSEQEWINSKVRQRMMKVAHQAAKTARELAPNDVRVLYTTGYLHYFDPDHSPKEALSYYEQALQIDPQHDWSLLYRAHCFQDLELWTQAAEAYSQVNPAFFVGYRTWRYEHLLEQRAYCWLRAGEIERAQKEFESLLTRWEKNSHLAQKAWAVHIVEAAQGPLHEVLYSRILALYQKGTFSARWNRSLLDEELQ